MKQKFLKKISCAFMALLMTVSLFSEGLTAWADTVKNTQHTLYGWGYDFSGSGLPNAYDPLTGDYTNTAFRNKWANEFYYWTDADGNYYYCVQLGTSHVDSATMDMLTYDNPYIQTYYSDNTQRDNLKACTIYAYKGETKYGYDWETELVAAQTMTWIVSGGYFDNNSEKLSDYENTVIKCVKAPSSADHDNLVECCKKLKVDILKHFDIPKGTSLLSRNAPTYKLKYNTSTQKYEGTFTFDSSLSQFSFPSYSGVTFKVSGSDLTVTATLEGLEKLKSGAVTLTKTKAKNCDKIEECVPLFFTVQSGRSSQAKVGYMSGSDPVQAYAKFTADTSTLSIKKTFSSDGKTVSATAAQNSAVTFRIYKAGTTPTSYINAVKEADGVYSYSAESGTPTEYQVSADGDLTIKNLPINSALWIEETKTAPGYALAERTAAPVTTENAEYTIDNSKINFEVSKRDVAGNEIAGAVMQLIDEKGNTKLQWTSTQKPIVVSGLSAGKYTLRETYAPDGYTLATDIAITITDKGVIKADGVNVTAKSDDGRPLIVMVDKAISVEISKKAITGDDELPGAKLQIRDGETVVEEWISTDKPHIITGILKAGKTYTLHEEIAPDGYVVANDIQFTVNDDGTANVVEMRDDTTKVEFYKLDDKGNNLPGAKLRIVDSKGNIVKEWTSTAEAYKLEAELVAGLEYTLQETEAPKGYVLSADVKFTVSSDGRIDKVEMINRPTVVEFSKKSLTGAEEIPGAVLYVADENGEIIEKWTSTDKPHIVTALLEAGKTYTLHEEVVPNGYVVSSDIEFTVSSDGSADIVTMYDDCTKVVISKKAITGDDELPGASLKILDGDNVIDSWVSTDKPHEILA
ncbi:MAG: SpaA isopeptide-forming pilin-related protein, partial [Ruminococcus sp.]|nr:SpaA isopeptide-forming pilin-related protein [Ruminococcus sp.]